MKLSTKSAATPPPSALFEFDAIGTHWWCEALVGEISPELRCALVDEAARFNQAYSRFRDDSLITKLNVEKTLESPPAELLAMFAYAQEMYTISDGAFDISVGGTLHAQGYGSRVHGAGVVKNFWQTTSYTTEKIVLPSDAVIDLGGFGKGWLIDIFATLFREHGVSQYIINGGGDMWVEAVSPVDIALEDPRDPALVLTTLPILGGFAASSQGKRTWVDGTTPRAHIIDPATNNTATPNVSGVFVQAATATLADTLATILFVRPSLHDALRARYNIHALLVSN